MEGRRQVYYRCWQVEATRIKSAQGRHSFSFGWLPTKNVVTDPKDAVSLACYFMEDGLCVIERPKARRKRRLG